VPGAQSTIQRHQTLSVTDDDLAEQAISQEIQGQERARLHKALVRHVAQWRSRSTPIDPRHISVSLYDFETKAFYVNKKELRGALEVGTPITGTSNAYRLTSGAIRYVPHDVRPAIPSLGSRSAQYVVTEDYASGPYRRLFTEDLSRFTATGGIQQATIYAPCQAQARVNQGVDLGYIYMGEWGEQNDAGPEGGLQYNYNNIPSTDTYDTFFTVPHLGYVSTSNNGGYHYHSVAGGSHIGQYKWNCAAVRDHGISMSWEFDGVFAADPPYDNTQHAEFWVHTVDYQTNDEDDLAVSVPYPGGYGTWPPPSVTAGTGTTYPCYHCVMKRMTSIGQPVTNLGSNDAFGPVKWSNASVNCDPLAGCQVNGGYPKTSPWLAPILAACSEYPSWSGISNGAAIPAGEGDCRTNTGDIVQVSYIDTANEIVYISLNGSTLNTQSWPFTPYSPSCSPDSYGYCVDSTQRNMTKVSCGRFFEVVGTIVYNIYSPAGGGDTAFTAYIDDDLSGTCTTQTSWDPEEPTTLYGDPNLP
jgi:hypothetical protein